ncbi:MAG: hypothetical protein U9N14_06195 [Pseudomonadota bacterium]|nr:hypothetical protein [Pseudomonadota bacterium]
MITKRFQIQSDGKDKVFLGPWIGEFGWELLYWQGWVRKFIADNPNKYIIAASYEGHYPFYESAHEFWALPDFFTTKGYEMSCARVYARDDAEKAESATTSRQMELEFETLLEGVKIISPQEAFRQGFIHFREPSYNQKLIALKPSSDAVKKRDSLLVNKEPYVVIMARKRCLGAGKNWDDKKWEKLANLLISKLDLHIVIGGRKGSSALEGYSGDKILNLMEYGDSELYTDLEIAFMKDAKISIGSEGGTLLFSLLCGCPTFGFGRQVSKERVEVRENPLRTRVEYYPIRDPDISELFDKIQEFIK